MVKRTKVFRRTLFDSFGFRESENTFVVAPPPSSIFSFSVLDFLGLEETQSTPVAPVLLPSIASISPNSGLSGTSVTIMGTGFTDATSVMFGTIAAKSFTVVHDDQIVAIAP